MKKIILGIMSLMLAAAPFAHANTKTPAKDVTTDVTQFGGNIPTSATDVQKALQSLNDINLGGPAGVNRQFQINNNGIFGGGNMFDVSGNVGVNTQTPASPLEVNGVISSTAGGFKFPDGSVQTTAASGGGGGTPGGSNNQVQINSSGGFGGGNLYSVNNNVGIGTPSPINMLDINGGVSIGTYAGNTAAPANGLIISGNVGINFKNPVNALDMVGNIRTPNSVIAYGLTDYNNSTYFVDPFPFSGGVSMYASGNIGLGTASPRGKLDATDSGAIYTGDLFVAGHLGLSGFTSPNATGAIIAQTGFSIDPTGAGPLLYFTPGYNMGVGTSNPTAMFEVAGQSKFAAGNIYVPGVVIGSSLNTGLISPSTNAIGFVNNNAETMRITSVGNVGMGTSAPNRKLDVVGSDTGTVVTTASSAAVGITNTDQTNGNHGDLTWLTSDANGAASTGARISGVFTSHAAGAVSGELAFLTRNAGTNSEKMRLTAGGNLGVGSITPGALLDVAGTARMTGFQLSTSPTSGYVLTANSAGIGTWAPATGGGGGGTAAGGTNAIQYNSGSSTFAGDENKFSFNGANVGIGTFNGTSGSLSIVKTGSNTLLAASSVAGGGGDYFVVANSGNVGVGSINPGVALDVGGTIRASSDIKIGAQSVCQANGTNCPAGTSNLWSIQNTTDQSLAGGNVGIGTTATTTAALTVMNGNVGIGTWKPNGMLVIMNGNVGIASIAPQAGLDIGSSLRVGGVSGTTINSAGSLSTAQNATMSASGTALTISAANSSILGSSGTAGSALTISGTQATSGGGLALRGSNSTSNSTDLISFLVGGNNTAMRIQNSPAGANVGIGTFLPFSRLAVNGSVGIGTANSTYVSSTTAPSGGLLIEGNTGIGTYLPSSLLEVGSRKFNILSNGNVGIGSINPGALLDVSGGIRSSGSVTADSIVTTGSGVSSTTGNLGIGSTSPITSLDIAGTSTTINVIRMQSQDGTFWKCKPANTTGVMTCV